MMNLVFKSTSCLLFLISLMASTTSLTSSEVIVETIEEAPADAPIVTKNHRYSSDVTLYIENEDESTTPSGWSTRREDGAKEDKPFEFQPGKNLIIGWTEGVIQMKEGERAKLHVPSKLGYGPRPMGSKGGPFYIPANSNLLFDIKILGKVGVGAKVDL
mmetsp:Transcript_34268/g.39010  ORF Transcript_34268/g.39010 Transcript_34268/m.39010 type:complete len:159 (-) Transcript_34268:274-750(-)